MTKDNTQDKDQQKKSLTEKEQKQHSHKDAKVQPEQQAGMSTDKAAMKDEGYVQRIDEKTSKH